jgi:hypothetical protein
MQHLTAMVETAAAGFQGLRAHRPMRVATVVGGAAFALGVVAVMTAYDRSGVKRSGLSEGGETVMGKLAQVKVQAYMPFAEPTPVNRLLSMALSLSPTIALPEEAEPNLDGLSEIPPELIWNRPEKAEDEDKPRASFAAFSKAQEQLPWDAIEPVPFAPVDAPKDAGGKTAAKPAGRAGPRAPVEVAAVQIGKWLKTKITEIRGADRSRPLYHFELWIEPPAVVKSRLVGVSYAFSTPAIRPQAQASTDRTSGFRISAGGLACADTIELTLRFDDGVVQKVSVDGCELLS